MEKCNDIAILMATYNSDRYISEQLDSILSQTYPNWHLYIHDDGSTDNTCEILARYVEANPAKMSILDYPPLGNAYANFMSLLSRVEAPLYMFSDHDDVCDTFLDDLGSRKKCSLVIALGKDDGFFVDLCSFFYLVYISHD